MRFELDFKPPSRGQVYHGFLLAVPLLFVVLVFWLWSAAIIQTLSPFIVAFVLAYLLNPVIDWLSGENRQRFWMHRGFAIVLLYLLFLSIFLGVLLLIVPGVVRESSEFAGKLRHNYLPVLRERLQPRLEEWFSPRLVVENGRFTDWVEEKPSSWEVADGIPVQPLPAEEEGALIGPLAEDGWAMRQEIAALVGNETYTIRAETGSPYPEAASWSVHLVLHPATSEVEASSTEFHWSRQFDSRGLERVAVAIPSGLWDGFLELRGKSEAGQGLPLALLQFQKRPAIPIFDPFYVKKFLDRNRHLFTWENAKTVLGFGLRGAGIVAGGAGGIWGWTSRQLGAMISLGVFLTFLLVVLFYMLLDFTAFKRSCLGVFPSGWRPRILGFAQELDRQLGGFLRGQFTVCVCVGCMVSFFLILLRVPFALLIGMTAGLFNFVPYLGPAMGIGPAILLTLFEYFDPQQASSWVTMKLILVMGSFMLVQALDGTIISPKIMARTVDVQPLVVIAALMLGGGIAGVVGMVLALPVYCFLRVLMGEYRTELARVREGRFRGVT